MRARHRIAALAAVIALAAPAPVSRAEPSPVDLVVIVTAGNTEAPSAAALESIFLRKVVTWPSGERIIPLNGPPDSERRQRFDRVVLGMSPDDAARYWLDQRIRGGDAAPREVGDVMLTAKLVAKLPGTIGYVPADTPLAGVRIVARIHDDKVVPP